MKVSSIAGNVQVAFPKRCQEEGIQGIGDEKLFRCRPHLQIVYTTPIRGASRTKEHHYALFSIGTSLRYDVRDFEGPSSSLAVTRCSDDLESDRCPLIRNVGFPDLSRGSKVKDMRQFICDG